MNNVAASDECTKTIKRKRYKYLIPEKENHLFQIQKIEINVKNEYKTARGK